MKKCEICGRETNRTYKIYGYTLCSKHMHQYHKYGKFLDNNPRTNNDLNDYKIKRNEVWFNLYNQKNEQIDKFVIDLEDIEKVKYKKWRKTHGHVVTGQPAKKEQIDLSYIVLDMEPKKDVVIDHIDGNPMNNKKSNLRVCTQTENSLNKKSMSNNTSGFIGISYKKDRGTYDPEIRKGHLRCHLGATKSLEKAVYARYYAEKLVFQEYANEAEQLKKYNFTKTLPDKDKKEIEEKVRQKLINKKLWQ